MRLHREGDTEALARELACALSPGSVLALSGDLGAGKTTLVRFLCKELGIDESLVASPTFSVVHEYHGGRFPVAHVDLYRLGRDADALDLGLYDYLERGFILMIEWADYLNEPLDCPVIALDIRLMPDGTRVVQVHTEPGDQ